MPSQERKLDVGKKPAKTAEEKKRASYLRQEDVPAYPLDQALRVARAIADQYARKPTTPLLVASAMNLQPGSSVFRMLTGASIAYGLTTGAAQAPKIEITPLGLRIVHPLKEGDDNKAKREAVLQPKVIGEFLNEYNGSKIPRRDIAINVLVTKGVPEDKAEAVLDLILESARAVGFIKDIKDEHYVYIDEVETPIPESDTTSNTNIDEKTLHKVDAIDSHHLPEPPPVSLESDSMEEVRRRVFITHGKNKDLLATIKKLITFGKMEPVVSVEHQTVSKPVPEKVMEEMRGCGAAIIHVDKEGTLADAEGVQRDVINSNVLVEIGAAMALYGRRYVLLVREGVQLPSNLQGLYEVRYKSETLDADVTVRLLEAINDIQNNPVPNRY